MPTAVVPVKEAESMVTCWFGRFTDQPTSGVLKPCSCHIEAQSPLSGSYGRA